MKTKLTILLVMLSSFSFFGQEIAVLKYTGGGDWYANPTALTNLINYCNTHINTTIKTPYKTVEVGSLEIFQYPYVHLTGHGNVYFSENEAENLRNYLYSGGFLHIDDNYGLDTYIRRELKKVFPNNNLMELPVTHPIFTTAYNFTNGLPKIHEHDGKRPQAFGYFNNGRLICLYTTEADLGDGWENKEVHNDPDEIREKALKMGANIIKYVFSN